MKGFVNNNFNKVWICILQITLTIIIFENHLLAQTQGQKEEKWAKDIFNKHTKIQDYPKFTGQITKLDSNSFKFDEKTLIMLTHSEELKILLENGIFYPNIIVGNSVAVTKTKQQLDSLSDSQKFFYNISRTDSLKISNFEELKSLSKSPKQKIFKFYLYNFGIMKPTICYIELTNKDGTKGFDRIEFMKGCRVTYFEDSGILF
ncbi:MAG: hypothetical protein CVU06_05815 [Bacteroidetes bacterium HGW-Bacteroidetes-22]|nr:MAG: hypothetical protein CVU06_05815 [Bacteroidetes bacterium HGW-Bacteroidetes-22]